MKLVERSRTLRVSTRQPSSSYKVNTEGVGSDDTLQLTIQDEGRPGEVLGVFEFRGSDVADRASIHFTAEQRGDDKWELRFSGARPIAVTIG